MRCKFCRIGRMTLNRSKTTLTCMNCGHKEPYVPEPYEEVEFVEISEMS